MVQKQGMKMTLLILVILLSVSCGDSHIVNDTDSKAENVNSQCELTFSSEELCLDAKWEVMPTSSTFGSMILTFTDLNDPNLPVTPINEPFVMLWMPSMGHGSSPVSVEFIETGKYRIKDVFFIMPGPWDIHYQLKSGSTVVEELIQKIDI
jgi:hypothetical protein